MININALQNLLILADPVEQHAPPTSGRGILNVTDAPFHADPTGTENPTGVFQHAIDQASERKGAVYVPTGVYQISSLLMKSDVQLYLQGGAVLRGTGVPTDYLVVNPDAARLGIKQRVTTFLRYAEGASNVVISGRCFKMS